MADYDKILSDPYNPVVITPSGEVKFPDWLDPNPIQINLLKPGFNETVEDAIIKLHAEFYDATNWYEWIKKYTPESIFMELTENEIKKLIYDHEFPQDKIDLVKIYLDLGFNFVKSSKKSSQQFKKVITFEDFMDEITHPDVIMSFKKGCRHLFFRQFIDSIQAEYRIYVYKGKMRYVELYKPQVSMSASEYKCGNDKEKFIKLKDELISFVSEVMKSVKYQDYVLDVCFSPKGFNVIEINTPLYLFGGIHLGVYFYESDAIHNSEEPIFKY